MVSQKKSGKSSKKEDDPILLKNLKPGDTAGIGGKGVPLGQCRVRVVQQMKEGTLCEEINDQGVRTMRMRFEIEESGVYVVEVNGDEVF